MPLLGYTLRTGRRRNPEEFSFSMKLSERLYEKVVRMHTDYDI